MSILLSTADGSIDDTLNLLSTAYESIGDTLITAEGGVDDALVLLSSTDACIALI